MVPPSGPCPSPLMIVGDAPDADAQMLNKPFVGASGHLLDCLLDDADLSRSIVFTTNVARVLPPGGAIEKWIAVSKKDIQRIQESGGAWYQDKMIARELIDGCTLLHKEIELCKPKVIIALGDVALWALTGKSGLMHWRGSTLSTKDYTVIPTLHPTAILRQWAQRAIVVNDLRRAGSVMHEGCPTPEWTFTLQPTLAQVLTCLDDLLARAVMGLWLVADIETSRGHITCLGLAWSRAEAICIPFTCSWNPDGYWGEEEEALILWKLNQLFRHPKVTLVGQNFLYDAQYLRRNWCFGPRHTRDTMVMSHCLRSDELKSLDYLASKYCRQYVQWKPQKRWEEKEEN